MPPLICTCLSVILLMAGRVSAQAIPPGGAVADRPSAERLSVPDFAPKEQAPGVVLPPVPHSRPKGVPGREPQIIVREFCFNGNSTVADQALQAIAAPFLARPIGATDLEQLRHLLTRHYIDQGYINSGAVLPKQVFADGVIRFQIIEGELSEIRVTGTGRLRPDYVRERLELGAGPPLNDRVLQDRFQLLLADPLIERMDGRLRPGSAPGQSILDVNVTRAQPYSFALSFDNERPPSTGAEEIRLDGQIRNITGFGDSLNLSLGYGEKRLDVDVWFTLPVTRYDTLLGFQFSDQRASILEEPLADLDIDNRFRSYEIALFQPVYRTLQQRFILGARLARRKTDTTLRDRRFPFSSGDEESGESKVTALRLSQEWIDSRSDRAVSLRSTLSVGLRLFDATWHGDNRPDGDFIAWLGQAQYARKVMDNGAQLHVRADVQFSNDALLSLEQYAIGGVYSVRGYRTNEVVRDQGYSLSVELHFPLFGGDWVERIPGIVTAIPFMDYGAAWDKGERGDKQYLHGVGIGLAWSHPRYNVALFYAHDLKSAADKPEYDLQDESLYFRFTTFLF